MTSRKAEKVHIRHCMLYEFRKGNNAAVATQNICHVYPNALNARKCQRWFSKFKSGNYDLSDSHRSGRPRVIDDDLLRAEVEANPGQTIEQLAIKLKKPWSTVQSHLQDIGKATRAEPWVCIDESDDSATQKCNTALGETNSGEE